MKKAKFSKKLKRQKKGNRNIYKKTYHPRNNPQYKFIEKKRNFEDIYHKNKEKK